MLEAMRQRIADEIDRLMVELTVTLPQAIQRAVEHGDLSENAEYKSALERQQFVQARLNHLTQRASELSKIDPNQIPADRVGFGSRVTLKDAGNGEVIEYTIVFGDFIDLDANQISMASPIGRALLGQRLGDEVLVLLPRGDRTYHITDLVTLTQMVQG
jgi:transcription elongation factor GreA